jgi:hypothetical protein
VFQVVLRAVLLFGDELMYPYDSAVGRAEMIDGEYVWPRLGAVNIVRVAACLPFRGGC